jgi:hypothetical protein
VATYGSFPIVCLLVVIPQCHTALGREHIFNLVKVAFMSLLRCDMPFTEPFIIAQRTKTSFTKQSSDKVHLKIGEEIAKLFEAKGAIMLRNQ